MDIKSVIEEFYMVESEEDYREAETKTLSIAVNADTASMLKAFTERFGTNVSAFGGQILEDVVSELFLYLEDSDKAKLAEIADRDTTAYLEKKGVLETWNPGSEHEEVGRHHWRHKVRTWEEIKAESEQEPGK